MLVGQMPVDDERGERTLEQLCRDGKGAVIKPMTLQRPWSRFTQYFLFLRAVHLTIHLPTTARDELQDSFQALQISIHCSHLVEIHSSFSSATSKIQASP